MTPKQESEKLRSALRDLEQRLAIAEATLNAIRGGEVDALVLHAGGKPAVYTLKSAGEPYRLLIEQMADGALTVSSDGVILYCNAAFAAMMQRPRERLVGATLTTVVSCAGPMPCLDGIPCTALEVELQTTSGLLPALMSCSQIEVDGEKISCLVVTDVSRQRELLQHALTAASAGVWTWEITPDVLIWSPENDAVFGVPPGSVRTRADWGALVHPDDRGAAYQAIDDAVAGRTADLQVEFRATRPDGEERWIAGLGRVERAPDGTPLRMRGINLDITERKRAETVLRAAHDTFCQLVEKSPFGVYIIDADFRFAYASKAVEELFKMAPLVGRGFVECLHNIRSDDYVEARATQFRDILNTGRAHGGTVSTLLRGTKTEESFEWRADRITMPDGRYGVVCHYYDLSERENYERELRESEKRLETTLESIGDGFFALDTEWRFVYINAAGERLLGIDRQEVLGKSYWEVLPPTLGTTLEREYRLAAAGEPRYFENFYEPWRMWFYNRCFPRQGGGMVVYFRDITEQKEAEEALRRSEERYRILHESQRDPFVRVAMDGRLLEFNDLYCEMLGHSAEELRQLTYQDLTPARWHEMEERIVRDEIIARGYSDVYEKEYRRKDGRTIPVELRIILSRDAAGNPESMWGVVRDISQRKADEARTRSLTEQLLHVARVGELGQVSATIAHELNQPLAAMLNYAGLARRMIANDDRESREKAWDAIQKAGEQAIRASEIIRRMRGFVERRTTECKSESINKIVEEAAALALIGAKAENITTRLQLAPNLAPVLVDRVQIQQVLVNLLNNAVDATAECQKREITVVTAVRRGGGVEVSVADTGCGIPDDVARKLFTPFVTTKPGGMGIGLAISRSIVQAHGGDLNMRANEGGGTVFRFTLPSAAEAPARMGDAMVDMGGRPILP